MSTLRQCEQFERGATSPRGVSYSFVYDAANRLVEVKQGELAIATFLYDAAGNRVKGTVAGVTTVYIAGLYEQSGSGSTSYYEGGAMRRTGYPDGNGVYYLLQDQLKSTSVIVSEGGAEAAREYYYPFGGNRGGVAFSDLTTKRFTGQYHEQGLPGAEGLSYYNARWYDPQLGRFTSPDTIVPKPQNPQDFNRYSYAKNNPFAYSDPSGHYPCKAGLRCPGPGGNPIGSGANRQASNATSSSFLQVMKSILSVLVSMTPNLYIRGVGASDTVFQGNIEKVYDFSRNEYGYFYAYGTGAGSDALGAGASIYSGVGWKRGTDVPRPISDAYKGRAVSVGATINDLPVPVPSVYVTVSIAAESQPVYQNGHKIDVTVPRFADGIFTLTAGAGKSVDLVPTGVDGRISQVQYEYIGLFGLTKRDSDMEFALDVSLDPSLSASEKSQIISYIFAVKTINGKD